MTSFRLHITETARADLKEIHDFIAEDDPEAAKHFLQELVDKLFDLAAHRVEGVSREWVSKGLTMFPYKDRCFYFRVEDDSLFVVRVLHEKQDVSGQGFFE